MEKTPKSTRSRQSYQKITGVRSEPKILIPDNVVISTTDLEVAHHTETARLEVLELPTDRKPLTSGTGLHLSQESQPKYIKSPPSHVTDMDKSPSPSNRMYLRNSNLSYGNSKQASPYRSEKGRIP